MVELHKKQHDSKNLVFNEYTHKNIYMYFFHAIYIQSHMSSIQFWNDEKTEIKVQPLRNETAMQSWSVGCWNTQQVISNEQYAQQSGLPVVSMAWFSNCIHQGHIKSFVKYLIFWDIQKFKPESLHKQKLFFCCTRHPSFDTQQFRSFYCSIHLFSSF
jgi:hypothetical protein